MVNRTGWDEFSGSGREELGIPTEELEELVELAEVAEVAGEGSVQPASLLELLVG